MSSISWNNHAYEFADIPLKCVYSSWRVFRWDVGVLGEELVLITILWNLALESAWKYWNDDQQILCLHDRYRIWVINFQFVSVYVWGLNVIFFLFKVRNLTSVRNLEQSSLYQFTNRILHLQCMYTSAEVWCNKLYNKTFFSYSSMWHSLRLWCPLTLKPYCISYF